ncbi:MULTISPECIES: NAD-dependent epimerase/dehydratase family protein [Microbacterium]|uniref:NAD-dependent epimerase/dehydratase family protein n=1 Tax=Microbacterium TaxID=33882 RepID=UPI001E352FFA|nr:NAD-dependent epimerase/dehydratase family protein [Microbacterium nymphoidis]MCD2499725.1 NAD-dependent epimerase/dehydratase family protein [Microbacterium nymphoidis]
MRSALLGATGFVGRNLRAARTFDDLYDSRNIGDIAGRTYDVVFSAATRADSHRINADGGADRAEIDTLIERVSRARIERLVLISTVCVFPAGTTPDEETMPDENGLTPYGRNRLHMERVLSERFDTVVLRLPQLYGDHLRKGVVHDLLRNHRVAHIRPDDHLQHYDVRRLAADAATAMAAGITTLNIATAPIRNDQLAERVFGIDIRGQEPPEPPSPFAAMYTRDMRTRHSALFAGTEGYMTDAAGVLAGLRAFVDRERAGA